MLDKLAGIEERYEELDRLISDPEVIADYTKAGGLFQGTLPAWKKSSRLIAITSPCCTRSMTRARCCATKTTRN